MISESTDVTEILMVDVPLIIYAAYMNKPNRNILLKHYGLVQQIMLLKKQSRVMVLGDFNLHSIKWKLDKSDTYYLPQNMVTHTDSEYFQTASEFLEKIHHLPMFQLSNVTNIASNVLDLVFVNGTDDVQSCEAPVAITRINETDIYHPPLEITFEYHRGVPIPTTNKTTEVFAYDRGNYERMLQQLNEVNFAQVFDRMDVESAFDYFYEYLGRLINENIPKRLIKVNNNNNKTKWWTQELQSKKNRRDKLYKRKPKNERSQEYDEAVREFNELNDELEKKYIDRVH